MDLNIEILTSDPSLSSAARRKLNEYFVVWVCLPNTQKQLSEIITSVKQGSPLPARLPLSPSLRSPKAPSSPPRSPLSPLTKYIEPPFPVSPRPSPPKQPVEPIPTEPLLEVYFPLPGRLVSDSSEFSLIRSYFPSSLSLSSTSQTFIDTVKLLGLPSFAAPYLASRIVTGKSPVIQADQQYSTPQYTVSLSDFTNYYHSKLEKFTPSERLYNILSSSNNELVLSDFGPLVQHFVHSHKGMTFLRDTPEFQTAYAQTVCLRFMYTADPMAVGYISRIGWRRSKISEASLAVDTYDDANMELSFYSYEHFYVLYCRFWELDVDRDNVVTRDDLLKYGNYALGSRAIDRILAGVPRKLTSSVPSTMNFHDFVAFCLSEEDKSSDASLVYWLRVCDLDGDGVLSLWEMEFFYEEQIQRVVNSGHETVNFEDLICQVLDIINPSVASQVTLADLKRCGCRGALFNYLLNIHKFFFYEQRDPFDTIDPESAEQTEWARFARNEYDKLASDGDEVQDWSMVY
ncbi:hypothetical protein RCL1_007670 [Eukaryota sp. TZLM3-RCL]